VILADHAAALYAVDRTSAAIEWRAKGNPSWLAHAIVAELEAAAYRIGGPT